MALQTLRFLDFKIEALIQFDDQSQNHEITKSQNPELGYVT